MNTQTKTSGAAAWSVSGMLLVLLSPVAYALFFDVPLMRSTGAPAFAMVAAGAAAGILGLRRGGRKWARLVGGASVIALPLSIYMFFGFAALVGLQRIVSSSHFPSDVCVGAAVGWVMGQAALALRQWWRGENSGVSLR